MKLVYRQSLGVGLAVFKSSASTDEFARTGWLCSTAVAALVAVTTPAFAAEDANQVTANDDATAIIVSGTRHALEQAVRQKRDASLISDVISAEDIGRFPDVNVAESIQRVTGVQINRTRGEGRTVNVRGLPADFTLVTLNGRSVPNALVNGGEGATRSFDFSALPPEFVNSLAVYKSSSADITDGGLSGTVDVRTPRPFDIGKQTFSASAQGEYESNSGKWSPRLSAFYSDVLADGRLGVSLGLSYTRRQPETHRMGAYYSTTTEGNGIPSGKGPDDLNGNGVIEPNLLIRIPSQVAFYNYEEDSKRYSAISSVQYKASDTLTFSVDGFYSKLDLTAVTNENLHNFRDANTVVSAEATTIDGVQTPTKLRVADLDNRGGGRFEDRNGYIWSVAGKTEYEAGPWTASLEVARSISRQHLDNLNIADIAYGEAEYVVSPSDDIGSIHYYNGYDLARLDPANFRVASINGEFNRNTSDKAWDIRADLKRHFGDSGLTDLRFGVQYNDRAQYQDNNRLTIGAAGVSQLYGGLPVGPVPGSYSAAPFMKLRSVGNGKFLSSYKGNAIFPTEWLSSDTRGFVSQYTDEELIAAGSLTNDATGITDVKERLLSAYVRADGAVGRFSGNLGLRVVNTRQQSVGVSPNLSAITVLPDAGGITRVPAAQPLTVKRDYTDALPSLNLRFDATNEFVLRFAASRTVARPTLSEISPTATANGTLLSVTRNNPYLDPFRADNLDVSAEWYFGKDALLGGAFFYKNLKSLIRRQVTIEKLPVIYERTDGSTQQATLDFAVSSLANGSGVKVKGFELYYQQAFTMLPAPFDGLGTVLNYTYIDNSDPTQLTAASKHNYNLTGYYEKGPLGVRLSYSWRSKYLSTATVAPLLSQYTKAYGTLDGSINVNLKSGISLVLEAVNLLDADDRVYFSGGLPANYTDPGRRIFAGVRFSL